MMLLRILRTTLLAVTVIALSVALGTLSGGCAPTAWAVRPVDPFVRDNPIEASRAHAFDATLKAAQELNLNVLVLDRESGLVRFEAASLGPSQLDRYCLFPLLSRSDGQALYTFVEWSSLGLAGGPWTVRGAVTITILISGTDTTANLNVRTNWTTRHVSESYSCQSTGVFEQEFIETVRRLVE